MLATEIKELKTIKQIDRLKGVPEELFMWKFIMILLENELMPPWVLIYGPHEGYRIT